MTKPTTFIFDSYSFDEATKTLKLNYGYDNGLKFTEEFVFDFEFVDYSKDQLDRAIEQLFYLAGVSYFKLHAPENIQVKAGQINYSQGQFYSKTYEKGLGEFWYVNKLDPKRKVDFPVNSDVARVLNGNTNEGLLVGIGGGKDSLVVVEGLKSINQEFMTWSLNHKSQLEPLVNTIGTKHAYVGRTVDPKVIELNKSGEVFNGHIPISAIIAATSVTVAILTGKRDVVVGNESSANEPTLSYRGVDINHQYSKSQEFERDYQGLIKDSFGQYIRYYSFLRPLSELYIAEIFARLGFNKYKGVFSSCNRAYTLDSHSMSWCGVCPKCAFVFMVLTPFIGRAKLESIWQGKNLLLDKNLVDTYKNLLGISGYKPLECVGEIKEARMAMKLCFKVYLELKNVYEFYLPEDYDYRTLSSSEMPEDIKTLFDQFITKFRDTTSSNNDVLKQGTDS